MTRLVIITGVPGVGKTTSCTMLTTRLQHSVHINFGDLILMAGRHHAKTRAEIRANPTRLIPPERVAKAQALFLNALEAAGDKIVFLDSHAVVYDHYGFRIIPEITNFERINMTALIALHSDYQKVLRRLQSRSGRQVWNSEADFLTHRQLQDATAINFCLRGMCPMFVVTNNGTIEECISKLETILTSIGLQ